MDQAQYDKALDFAKLSSQVYDWDDYAETMDSVQVVEYGARIQLAEGVEVRYVEAGHIMGSAMVELLITDKDNTRKIVLTGDMGSVGTPLLRDPAVVKEADVVVGAVLIPGAKAPRLVTREMLGTMKKGSVLVDVAIDQGGCFETSKATTHGEPTYVVDGVIHYCVANMPGAVAKTSALALTNATLPYAVEIANKGWKKAMQENTEIKLGANVIDGKVTYQAVAEAFDLDYTPVESLIGG